jgi:hypothetical protein
MIINSGFLKNDKLIPIIKDGNEGRGIEGELQSEETKSERGAMLNQIASLP